MVRRDTRSAENERRCTRHRSARRGHWYCYFSRRKQFVRDQAGRYRWHSAGTSFIEHDCDLGKPDDVVTFNDPNGIANGNPKSNTGEDSGSRVKTDLRTGATLSHRGKTVPWSRTKLGQFPRFVRHKWECRCGPNYALHRQPIARPSGRCRASGVAFGTGARMESRGTDHV